MGGSVNPVKIVGGAIKPVTKLLAPQAAQQGPMVTQLQPAVAATAAQSPAVVQATQDSETGVSNEKAIRKGKRSLQIARSTGSGTGLNV